jgi:nucleoside-triphosphatase THEP1
VIWENRVLKKQMKADRAEKTVLVVIVDELGTSEFVKLELLGSELERVLGMHGTVVSVGSDEMSTREQLVYDYFFTPKGKHRHKSSKKRADGPFDHAILVYYNRS